MNVLTIIRDYLLPIIAHLNIDTGYNIETAVILLAAIGQHETGYRTEHQDGGGPALSYWQIEPPTMGDALNVIRKERTHQEPWRLEAFRLVERIKEARRTIDQHSDAYLLEHNITFAVIVARLVVVRKTEFGRSMLPARRLDSVAAWWKQHWNTPAGAGTVAEFVERVGPHWQSILEGATNGSDPGDYGEHLLKDYRRTLGR